LAAGDWAGEVCPTMEREAAAKIAATFRNLSLMGFSL
jgi:hypothetical protein